MKEGHALYVSTLRLPMGGRYGVGTYYIYIHPPSLFVGLVSR